MCNECHSQCTAPLLSAKQLSSSVQDHVKDVPITMTDLGSFGRSIMLGAPRLLVTILLYCAAAAARASANTKKVEDEVRSLVRAQVQQANMLSTGRQELLQLVDDAKQAQQAQRDAEERAQHAETHNQQHCCESKWPFNNTASFCVSRIDSVLLPYSCCHFLEDVVKFAC